VGVIGAGQLARMMGEVSGSLGVEITVLASELDDAAIATCAHVVRGDAIDVDALDTLSHNVDVITFDHEQVNLAQIADLERRGVVVRPSSAALHYSVDKAFQRTALQGAGVAVPRFVVVDSTADPRLGSFLDDVEGPCVIKMARGGYDGRGVWFPQSRAEALGIIERLGVDVVVEEGLALLGEVAQLIVRGVDGSTRLYPLVTTVQVDAMCAEVHFPADVTSALADDAARLATQLAELLDVVGVLAIELFVTSRCGPTTRATGRSRAPPPASSRITCARSLAGPSVT
jgi:5-(carboxyamino)imidazole ribonucleotide synthase